MNVTTEIDFDLDLDDIAASVASEIDLDDLACEINKREVAECIDLDTLADHLNYTKLAAHVEPELTRKLRLTGTDMFDAMMDGLSTVVADLTSEDKAARTCGQMRAARLLAVLNQINTGLIAALQEAAVAKASSGQYVDPLVDQIIGGDDC